MQKEELKKYKDYLTVGKLKEFLYKHNLPTDALVVVQRVEDIYYEKHNWETYNKKGYHTAQAEQWNIDIKDKFLDKEKYPLVEEQLVSFTEEQLDESMEKYTPAFCCVKYDNEDILFINLHY